MKKNRAGLAQSVALLSMWLAHSAPAVAADCETGSDGTAQQAEQKVTLLERLVGGDGSVQKVLDSGQTDAIASIEAAREAATQARESLEAGCAGTAAELANRGLNEASQALWLVQNNVAVGQPEYQALHRRTTGYLSMLEAESAESQGIGASDLAGIRRQLDRAELMAVNGQYSEAISLLEPAANRLERRLVVIREQQAADNGRESNDPEHEYVYLGEQYRAYLGLLQQLTDGRQLAMSKQQTYDFVLANAARLNDTATAQAGNGDWQAALTSMGEAVNNCQSAIRLIGVMN